MKNILQKIKINNLTYFLLFICLLSGMFKNILLIFLIIIIHEFGHIYFIKKYNYDIKSVELYPFGGITKIEKDLNAPIAHDLIITLGAFLFQIILFLIFYFAFNFDLISYSTYTLFNTYNKSIIIFNLLPIIPLDGHILLKCILEKIFTYKTSAIISIVFSIIGIICYLTYNYIYSINNYLIVTLLIYKTAIYIKNYDYLYNRFLLERYLNNYPYKKSKHENKISFKNFRRETLHFFKVGDKYVHEREILKKKFDKKRHF